MLDDVLYDFKQRSRREVVTYTTVGTSPFLTASYPWAKNIRVTCVGGGGGSGGCATAAAGSSCSAGGGGGGAYAEKLIPMSSLATQTTVTVGAGGTAGAVGSSWGGAGGASVFGDAQDAAGNTGVTHVHAGGGGGGRAGYGAGGNHFLAGAGGVASYGTLRISGSDGFPGMNGGGPITPYSWGGPAGGMFGGMRGRGVSNVSAAGLSYGGGAKGPYNGASQTVGGAAGAQGIVVVEIFG